MLTLDLGFLDDVGIHSARKTSPTLAGYRLSLGLVRLKLIGCGKFSCKPSERTSSRFHFSHPPPRKFTGHRRFETSRRRTSQTSNPDLERTRRELHDEKYLAVQQRHIFRCDAIIGCC
ncbi:hypothetical protein FOXYSP1_16016 [Fusarium oxysporum f. sp. phaseoli]